MTKQKSNERAFIKKIILVPIIAVLVVLISCSKEDTQSLSDYGSVGIEFHNNMKNEWWYPILKKHNIEPQGFNNFQNVFEMGTKNSIDNKIVTLENAFFLIRTDSNNYMIFRSPLAYHDLDSNIIIGEEGSLEKYSLKSKDTISLETLTAKKIKIQLNGKLLEATEAIFNDNMKYSQKKK